MHEIQHNRIDSKLFQTILGYCCGVLYAAASSELKSKTILTVLPGKILFDCLSVSIISTRYLAVSIIMLHYPVKYRKKTKSSYESSKRKRFRLGKNKAIYMSRNKGYNYIRKSNYKYCRSRKGNMYNV